MSAFVIAGCYHTEDDDSSNKYKTCEDIKSETSLFTSLKLNVTDDRISNYNYARVQVNYTNCITIGSERDESGILHYIYDVVDGTEPVRKSFLVAEAEGKNPTLKFKDVPDEYLINILKRTDSYGGLYDYDSSDINISNENAKVAVGGVYVGGNFSIGTDDGVWNTSGVPVAMRFITKDMVWSNGSLVYCNTDCDITGKTHLGGIIDIHLKKGWNKIFSITCSGFYSDEKNITIGADNVEFFMPAG